MLIEQRGEKYIEVNKDKTLDWDALKAKVAAAGMRNSNVMAIAPTATIANITGVSQSIEPTYQNLYVKRTSRESHGGQSLSGQRPQEPGPWTRSRPEIF